MRAALPRTADVFCRVVDNLGDAGVCWRLARQLAGEHGLRVRLWIDRPQVLARLAGSDPVAGDIAIHDWTAAWPPAVGCADLVIAAFACRLPEPYLDAMAARRPQPAWFNLEYLSAEGWVADAHGLASPRPDRPLVERFWFPGFDARTGGLLRERDLLARRDAFMADAAARAAACAALGVALPGESETLVSMFCYPHAPLADLLAACRDGDRPVRMLLPEGVGVAAFAALFGEPPRAGLMRRCGALTMEVVPIVPQPRYDELLWLCDVNFVRGEDSFVRAQWAGKPMVWNVYPQDDGADLRKLDAFLDRYAAQADPAADAVCRATRAWNGRGDLAAAWRGLLAARPQAHALAKRWCARLADRPDLTSGLLAQARKML